MKAFKLISYVLAAATAASVALVLTSTATVAHATDTALPADALKSDLAQYKASPGLTATVEQDVLVVSWTGQGGTDVRVRYAIEGGQPVVRELAVRKAG